MADIGGDGTTTVRKLEGFQITSEPKDRVSQPQSTLFRLIEHHVGHFNWSTGHDVNSIVDRLIRAYDHRPSHFHALDSVKIDHVRDTQRTGEYALEDRDDVSTAKTHHPELLIHEELEGSLLALHDTGSQENE
jgi:hypothetical protein